MTVKWNELYQGLQLDQVGPGRIVPESPSGAILGCLFILSCLFLTSTWSIVAPRNGKFFALAKSPEALTLSSVMFLHWNSLSQHIYLHRVIRFVSDCFCYWRMLNSHCREKSVNRVLSNLSLHSTLPWIDALSFCHSPFENITLSSSGAALDNIPHFSLATKETQGNERALSCHGIQTQFSVKTRCFSVFPLTVQKST